MIHRCVQRTIRMTTTCRQIRGETHLLFFRLQVFRFGQGMLQIWLRRFTAEQRASIRHVYVAEKDTRKCLRREFWLYVAKLKSLEKLVVMTHNNGNRLERIKRLCLQKKGEQCTRLQGGIGCSLGLYIVTSITTSIRHLVAELPHRPGRRHRIPNRGVE